MNSRLSDWQLKKPDGRMCWVKSEVRQLDKLVSVCGTQTKPRGDFRCWSDNGWRSTEVPGYAWRSRDRRSTCTLWTAAYLPTVVPPPEVPWFQGQGNWRRDSNTAKLWRSVDNLLVDVVACLRAFPCVCRLSTSRPTSPFNSNAQPKTFAYTTLC